MRWPPTVARSTPGRFAVYQLLATEGDTAATRERLRRYTLNTGLFNALLVENNNSTAAALAALANEPLPAYLLSINASNTPIGQLARDILGNAALSEQLGAGDAAALRALAGSTAAAQQTPTGLADTLDVMAASGNGSRRLSQDDTAWASACGIAMAVSVPNWAAPRSVPGAEPHRWRGLSRRARRHRQLVGRGLAACGDR